FGAAPALEDGGKLPAEIDGIAEPGVHAERARRRELMDGVAEEENRSRRVALRDHALPCPDAGAENLDGDVAAERAVEQRAMVDGLGRERAVAVERHEAP